jgi:hypothetical protein
MSNTTTKAPKHARRTTTWQPPTPIKTSTTPSEHQHHQQTARFEVMVVVGARPKVGVGVDDVFVPASTNRFVLMFQVVWWCW